MSKLIKVAEIKDVKPGTGKVVQAEGHRIALFNVAGTFHAIDNTCSHRSGPIGEGKLEGEVVTCPWHGAKFNVKTGEVLTPPARKGVWSFPVKVQGNDVLVEVE
jgi:nitrite reductase (NADH) small subunit